MNVYSKIETDTDKDNELVVIRGGGQCGGAR